jgi:hypothetical protein
LTVVEGCLLGVETTGIVMPFRVSTMYSIFLVYASIHIDEMHLQDMIDNVETTRSLYKNEILNM